MNILMVFRGSKWNVRERNRLPTQALDSPQCPDDPLCRVVSNGLAAARKTDAPTAEFCVKTLRPRFCSPDGDLYGIYGEAMEVIELNSAGELGRRAH